MRSRGRWATNGGNAVNVATAAILIPSAVVGFKKTKQCRAAKQELARTTDQTVQHAHRREDRFNRDCSAAVEVID
jgi:hypothetical protein